MPKIALHPRRPAAACWEGMHEDLHRAFQGAFGRLPTHRARAPGRVNLIGEHTDYNGLPVLPMAIQRAVQVACAARNDGRVRLVNADARRYAAREFGLSREIAPLERGDWANYVQAAAQELARQGLIERGMDAFVTGDVPPAAGLSSSSATVVAATLALLAANERTVAREELMELTARAERYVGVQSGGMDQAISLGGRAGHALRIDFEPLRTRAVRVPDEWRFVIANSRVGAEKAGRARAAYNARVAECRAALEGLLANPLAASWPRTWRGLVEDVPQAQLLAAGEGALEGDLLRRFRHVVTEGARVRQAVEALERDDRARFGRLMNDSHASLRDDYDVSCQELDDLVDIACDSGADGARLTGAGFGGCIVALASRETADPLQDALRKRFFRTTPAQPGDLFVALPSDGARVDVVASHER
jgi:galactokinase